MSASTFFDAMKGLLPGRQPSNPLVSYTENGAISLPTTQSAWRTHTTQPSNLSRNNVAQEQVGARLNLFFKTVRGLTQENLHSYLEAAWKENPLDTLRIIFQTRDCRGGKGERLLFCQMMQWLAKIDPQSVALNLHLVPIYGRWSDTLFIPGGCAFMSRQLRKDKETLIREGDKARVSLAAKWAPTEGHALDKKYNLVNKMVATFGPPLNATGYRKLYLSPLRKYLKIVERSMCLREWEAIDYSRVPSRAMKNYKQAFERHDVERFTKWKTALTSADKKTEDGEVVKVNAKQLFPHELVNEYYSNRLKAVDTVTEEQWKVLEQDLQIMGTFGKSVCLCDVSGSMDGIPMQVSIALGILISGVTAPPFKNQIITFESFPKFHLVQGATLKERVDVLREAPWGGSTNLQAAFDLILSRAVQFKVAPQDMPQRLYIFSDMQFDTACECNIHTNFETIDAKYRAAGYKRPQVIFWNLRAAESKEFPVTANENGVALLAGFSPSLLKSVMDGADMTPWGILRKILDNPRYLPITAASLEDDDDMVVDDDDECKSDKKKIAEVVAEIKADTAPVIVAPEPRVVRGRGSLRGRRAGRGGFRGRGSLRGARGGKRKH